jgi:acyl-CoA reductase-like NAD-dependent aldehyde dehydrogenase
MLNLARVRARIIEQRSLWMEELARVRQVDPFQALVSEILPLLDAMHWLQRRAAQVLRPQVPSWRHAPAWMLGHKLVIHRRPHGQVLIVGPGNYPLFLPGVQALQALVAGNKVWIKPQRGAEAPLQRLVQLLHEVGVPPHTLKLLDSDKQSVYSSLEAGADLVVLTGSWETGQQLLPVCARHGVPAIAELSGQDLVILGPDADTAVALRAVRWGRELNHGNTCMCPQRIWSPLPLSQSVEVPVSIYQDLGQLQQWLQQERYGLGISLFGGPQWVEQVLPHCRSGFVTINDIIAPSADPRAPFGGRGRSGYGVTRGAEGLLAMTYPQAVFTNRGPRFHLWPPSGRELALMQAYTDWSHGQGWRRWKAGLAMGWAWARLVWSLSSRTTRP